MENGFIVSPLESGNGPVIYFMSRYVDKEHNSTSGCYLCRYDYANQSTKIMAGPLNLSSTWTFDIHTDTVYYTVFDEVTKNGKTETKHALYMANCAFVLLHRAIRRHKELTNIFCNRKQKRGESQRKISEIRQKYGMVIALAAQVRSNPTQRPILTDFIYEMWHHFYLHPVLGYEKSPETLMGSGDFVISPAKCGIIFCTDTLA